LLFAVHEPCRRLPPCFQEMPARAGCEARESRATTLARRTKFWPMQPSGSLKSSLTYILIRGGYAALTTNRVADKAGALGSIVAAMGCAACFPALASFGAAIGLGFLGEYEGLIVSRWLPLVAGVAFVANALGWLRHRQWHRTLLGLIGPSIVIVDTVWFMGNEWTANVLYVGLAFMAGVSIWDLKPPANRRCGPDGCELPAGRA